MSFLINPYAFLAAGGDFESIATVTVGSGGASSIEFTSIPGTFQHLQIRGILRWTSGNNFYSAYFQPGGDTTKTNYRNHYLFGSGSSAGAGSAQDYYGLTGAPSNAATGVFGAVVADILDYASTSKNTVLRCISGYDNNGSGFVFLESALHMNTAALSSVTISGPVNFAQYSTLALYGIKAP